MFLHFLLLLEKIKWYFKICARGQIICQVSTYPHKCKSIVTTFHDTTNFYSTSNKSTCWDIYTNIYTTLLTLNKVSQMPRLLNQPSPSCHHWLCFKQWWQLEFLIRGLFFLSYILLTVTWFRPIFLWLNIVSFRSLFDHFLLIEMVLWPFHWQWLT